MTRSIGKGPFNEVKLKNNIITKIWSRRSVILPYCLNENFLIYNGKVFIKIRITEEMIGHKFGEFAKTRKRPIHKSKRR